MFIVIISFSLETLFKISWSVLPICFRFSSNLCTQYRWQPSQHFNSSRWDRKLAESLQLTFLKCQSVTAQSRNQTKDFHSHCQIAISYTWIWNHQVVTRLMVAVSGIGKQIQIIILPDVMTGDGNILLIWTGLSSLYRLCRTPSPHNLQYPYWYWYGRHGVAIQHLLLLAVDFLESVLNKTQGKDMSDHRSQIVWLESLSQCTRGYTYF